jgi:hypothetical protein
LDDHKTYEFVIVGTFWHTTTTLLPLLAADRQTIQLGDDRQ